MGKTLQLFLVTVVLKYNFSIKVFDSSSYHKMFLKYLQNLLKTMVSVAHKYSANEALATFKYKKIASIVFHRTFCDIEN